MQGLIDAAIAAASRNGVQAAVVLIGGAAANGAQVPSPQAAPQGMPQDVQMHITRIEQTNALLTQERDGLRTNLQAANAALHQAEGQASGPAATHLSQQLQTATTRIAELEQQLAGIAAGTSDQPMQGDALARIAELEQANKALQQNAAPQAAARIVELEAQLEQAQATPPALGAGEQPEAVQSFDSYGVEHLGLDPKCEKLVRKHYETIGALRGEFEACTTEEATKAFVTKTKLKKDYLVAIGIALLGKAPSAAAKPGGANAPTQGTGGAPDVPEGHADRTWLERLNAARAREKRMKEVTASLEELRAKAQKDHPDAFSEDEGESEASLKLDKLPKEVREEIQGQENTYNVVRGQMIACCWTCNLKPPQDDSDITTIDQSLESAGLGRLAAPNAAVAGAA